MSTIPSLDLKDFTSKGPDSRSKFVHDLGTAFTETGFVAISNHFLKEEVEKEAYDHIKAFFSLSDTVKQRYERPDLFGQRGYISKRKEHAKGQKVGDLKEFYHFGQPLSSIELVSLGYPENVWPQEVDALKKSAITVYESLQKTGVVLLQAIAIYLGLKENHFNEFVIKGNSILRAIHYFPLSEKEEEGAVRAAAHGDINLITLLMGASAEGLEIQHRNGDWVPVTALKDHIVVNVGDMLSRYTNDKLRSTIHRVVNPPATNKNSSRYSFPFFMHPVATMHLNCLPNCIDGNHTKKYEDITAGEFLTQRLKEIGLK